MDEANSGLFDEVHLDLFKHNFQIAIGVQHRERSHFQNAIANQHRTRSHFHIPAQIAIPFIIGEAASTKENTPQRDHCGVS